MAAAVSETAPRARWGQLTYSSFDRNDGTGGGWQVKDTTGGLDREEQELLRGRVQTQVDSGTDLPRFPTPAELEELPRRLVHAPADLRGTETALWHHVPAGHDASGRPGNVFAHVVLDRNPAAVDELRPIERWRSGDWLTPFGPESVLAATLTRTEPPRPGPLNRDTIASWLFAPRQWRMQTLAVLLDAVRAAFHGGPLVALGTEDIDEAAHWIAAVSFAMSAGTARGFFFSTLERPQTLAEAAERGLHLVCVPHLDLPALTRRQGIVVLDPAGVIDLGDLDGEPHRTPRGDEVVVGEWSVLIQEIFSDPRALADSVAELDRIAQSVGDSGLDPAWPAAMLVSHLPDAESRREASRVMAECAPPQLRSVPELYASAVAGLRREVDGRTDRAWRQVTKLGADRESNPPTVAGEVAINVYAELALADEPWLAGQGPAKLPSSRYFSPAPEAALVGVAQLLAPQISAFSPDLPPEVMLDEVRAGLHFVELALRLGLAHDRDLSDRLYGICQRTIMPALLHPELGAALVDSVDRTVSEVARHWLWTQLSGVALVGVPGERVAPAVLDTLGPGENDPDPLSATWAWLSTHPGPDDVMISPLLGEFAWHRVQQGEAGQDERFFAVWASLEAATRQGDPSLLSSATALLEPQWALERLIQLHLRWHRAAPPEWFVRALAEAPPGHPDTGFLAGELAERTGDSPVIPFAQLLLVLAGPDWLTTGPYGPTSPAGLTQALDASAEGLRLARRHGAEPARELLRRVNALVVLGLLAARARVAGVADPAQLEMAAGRAQASVAAFREAESGFTAEEAQVLVTWCDEFGVSSTALTELLLLADPRSSLRAPGDRVAGWLHAVTTGDADSPPITALVLSARLSRDASSRDRTTDEAMAALRSTPGSADDRAVRQTERFLNGWLRQAQTGRVRR